MDIVTKVLCFREGGHTDRCHTLPHRTDGSVAKHSWNMAMMYLVICPQPSLDILARILAHDIHERWDSDVTFWAKRLNKDLGDAIKDAEYKTNDRLGLSNAEPDIWQRSLDLIEFVMYADEEINTAGNRGFEQPRKDTAKILHASVHQMPPELAHFWQNYDQHGWRRTSDETPGGL